MLIVPMLRVGEQPWRCVGIGLPGDYPQYRFAQPSLRSAGTRRLALSVVKPNTAIQCWASPIYLSISLKGIKRRLSPSARVVPSSTSAMPSAQAALRNTPELWFG